MTSGDRLSLAVPAATRRRQDHFARTAALGGDFGPSPTTLIALTA
jgi:hypothetical protein